MLNVRRILTVEATEYATMIPVDVSQMKKMIPLERKDDLNLIGELIRMMRERMVEWQGAAVTSWEGPGVRKHLTPDELENRAGVQVCLV